MPNPRKPAKFQAGNTYSKQELKELEEKEEKLSGYNDKVMTIPEHLDEKAKEYYQFLTEELEISNLLANLDVPLLSQTSDCLARMDQADSYIREEGILIHSYDKNNNQVLKEHPAVNIKNKYLNQFRALSNQLGLSPSSRAALVSMNISKQEEESDPLLQLLKGD